MTKKKKKILIIVLVVVAAIIVIGGLVLKTTIDKLDKGLEELMAIEIENVELSQVADGTYSGAYKQFPIDVEVSVVLRDGKIQDIDILKHVNGKGKDGEKVIDRVMSEQSLEVDTVTGATYSSIVILKAIEQALINRN